ncbi:MAG: sigma-70 family RNA polymerase sigma factor [Actinomycetota bacterium]
MGSQEERAERFHGLYRANAARVRGYALRRVEQPADAGDVVAEVFLVAWRRLDRVPDGDGTLPWLLGVAARLVSNHRRGRLRHHRLGDRLRVALAVQIPARPDPAEQNTNVVEALQRLSERDREVIRLKIWEELSTDQISALLGIPTATVRTRLHRARSRMREALQELDEDSAGWLASRDEGRRF